MIMKRFLLIFLFYLIISIFFIETGFSEKKSKDMNFFEDFQYSVFLETEVSIDTKNDNQAENLWMNLNKFRVKTNFRFLDKLYTHLSFQGEYFLADRNTDQTDTESEVSLYEGYICWNKKRFRIKVGNQIIFWGKTDEINPTDNLNPQDLREYIIPDREERKIPVLALKLNFYLTDWILEGIWIPFFKSNELAKKNSDWEISQSPIPSALNINDTILFTHLKKEDTKKPSKKLKNSEWGIKITKTMSKVEYSFSYLYTWNDNPVVQKYFNVDSPPYLNIIIPVHKRQHIWGVDFNTFLGELGIIGEAVFLYKFFQTQDTSKQGALVKKNYLFYVVGADYTLFNDLSFSLLEDIYVNLQFVQQIIFKYNELIEEEKNRNFMTLKLSNKYFFDALEIDLLGMYSFDDKDYRINPGITYDFNDFLELNFGFEIIGGEKSTPLGQFNTNDFCYTKIKYIF